MNESAVANAPPSTAPSSLPGFASNLSAEDDELTALQAEQAAVVIQSFLRGSLVRRLLRLSFRKRLHGEAKRERTMWSALCPATMGQWALCHSPRTVLRLLLCKLPSCVSVCVHRFQTQIWQRHTHLHSMQRHV